jgi:hypothetical protein
MEAAFWRHNHEGTHMKRTALIMIFGFVITGVALAGELQVSPGEIIHPAPSAEAAAEFAGLPVGNTHMKADGLLLEAFLPRDPRKDRTFAERIQGLPFVNLMFRKSPPVPSDSGGYFTWKQISRRPWAALSARARNPGPFTTCPGDGPTHGLISLSF